MILPPVIEDTRGVPFERITRVVVQRFDCIPGTDTDCGGSFQPVDDVGRECADALAPAEPVSFHPQPTSTEGQPTS